MLILEGLVLMAVCVRSFLFTTEPAQHHRMPVQSAAGRNRPLLSRT
jgi:hypothetical protein